MRTLGPRVLGLAALAMLWGTTSCRQPGLGDADHAAIRQVLDEQRDAWNRGDLEAFMAGYERSPAIIFTSGGKVRRGWDDTLAAYRRRYVEGDATMGHLDFTDVEIRNLGSDAAVALGRFTLTETKEAGTGIFTLVFLRTDGRWSIVHDHSSADAG